VPDLRQPRRSRATAEGESAAAGDVDPIAPEEWQMTNQADGLGASVDDSTTAWDELVDQAHDDGQAMLEALARRARRLGRHLRRAKDIPVRHLRLMD